MLCRGLRCSSRLCVWPCTVHSVYSTTCMPHLKKHSIRHEMFADDTQLNHSESPENYWHWVRSLHDCVKDTGRWMEENKLNTTLQHPQIISLNNTVVQFAGIVRKIGFIFDSDLSMKQYIIKTCKTAYIEIRQKFHSPISHWSHNQDTCLLIHLLQIRLLQFPTGRLSTDSQQTIPTGTELCSKTHT